MTESTPTPTPTPEPTPTPTPTPGMIRICRIAIPGFGAVYVVDFMEVGPTKEE